VARVKDLTICAFYYVSLVVSVNLKPFELRGYDDNKKYLTVAEKMRLL